MRLTQLGDNAAPECGVTSPWILAVTLPALLVAIVALDLPCVILGATQVYVQFALRVNGRLSPLAQRMVVAVLALDVSYLLYVGVLRP